VLLGVAEAAAEVRREADHQHLHERALHCIWIDQGQVKTSTNIDE
jgi:hypothetical protein